MNTTADRRRFFAARRARHPAFFDAVVTDTRIVFAHSGRGTPDHSTPRRLFEAARLAWSTDAFAAQIAYRAKARLQALRIPILPRLLHRFAIVFGQIAIGDIAVIAAGVNIAHGQVVIDGVCEVGAGTTISPFVTVGLRAGNVIGPTIGRNVQIGTGARILGPITIGDGARIGANAVVVNDVPAGATAIGVPAQIRLSDE